MAVSHDVRGNSAATGLARLCESRRGRGVCALGREVAAHRSRVAARRLWHAGRKGEVLSVGQTSRPIPSIGNFDFRPLGSDAGECFSARAAALSAWMDMLGNGWEWTSTVFAPFPGFEPFPFYRGYSADFFDGKHFVMKGGSARTAACMLRPTFRNWFQAHYQYVYAGFRCVSRKEGARRD